MPAPLFYKVLAEPARSILTPTSGFIAEAGFTHSLTPARNCTYGCLYCYVPTMGIYGGLRPDDVPHWGHKTTFKSNASELLARALRPHQIVYCSPLVDPFQPAEADQHAMEGILDAVIAHPPRLFVLQTRSPRILHYLDRLRQIPALRVSFSITTDDERVRRAYEPHCETLPERWAAVRELIAQGIDTFLTLAPLLPCDPEHLIDLALAATTNPILCDPLHTRAAKPRGATTRPTAIALSERVGYGEWHDPSFQQAVVGRMAARAAQAGRPFATGPAAFRFLTLYLKHKP